MATCTSGTQALAGRGFVTRASMGAGTFPMTPPAGMKRMNSRYTDAFWTCSGYDARPRGKEAR